MTAALFSLALALAGAVAAIVWLAKSYASALQGKTDADRLLTEEKRAAESYIRERDANAVRIAELTSDNNALKQRIDRLLGDLNNVYSQARSDLVARMRASSADAAAVLDRILLTPLSSVPNDAKAGTGSDRGPSESSVPTASATTAGRSESPGSQAGG